MTREDILAMPVGRELDDLVAEKVMGWHARSKKWGGECEEYEDHWHDGQRFVYECAMFTPSTDISAAWEVEEKIIRMDDDTNMEYIKSLIYVLQIPENAEGTWYSILQMIHASPTDRCKAALLTVLEEYL